MDHAALLKWYTGRAKERMTLALALYDRSDAQGYWVPQAARYCAAALRKAPEAIKVGNRLKRLREVRIALLDDQLRAPHKRADLASLQQERTRLHGYESLYRALVHGALDVVQWPAVEGDSTAPPKEKELIAQGKVFVETALPYYQRMQALNRVRPPPAVTYLGISPTTTRTLEEMRLRPSTLRLCPIEWVRDPTGALQGRLLWPEGTRHGVSRFHTSAVGRSQCQACGHSIRNRLNWAPLLIEDTDGVPYSLWVGRDCAKSLFGIRWSGPLALTDGPHLEN